MSIQCEKGIKKFIHIVSKRGVEADKAKIKVIEKLTLLMSVRKIKSFLSHAGFYRGFIKGFSKIFKSLISLLMKYIKFNFNEYSLESFHKFKETLTSASIVH